MNENEEFQKAIQKIEPPGGAKERMLANIRAKAQAAVDVQEEADEAIKTGSQETQSKETKTDSKIVRWNARILRVVLPVAACLVIAVLAVVRFVPNSPIVGGGMEGDQGIYTSPYTDVASVEELEKLLGMEFTLPTEATEIYCSVMNNQIGYVNFYVQNHFYELTGTKESGDIMGELGTLLEEEIIDSEYNAILSVYDCDGLTVHAISWTDGENRYCLTNMDGCTKEELQDLY